MRQKFRCTKCGLRIEGKRYGNKIVAYDRGPSFVDAKVEAFVCEECREKPRK